MRFLLALAVLAGFVLSLRFAIATRELWAYFAAILLGGGLWIVASFALTYGRARLPRRRGALPRDAGFPRTYVDGDPYR